MSIAQAIHQVECGGSIHLNGTETEHSPYDCSASETTDYHPGIYVTKSLSMKSYYSVPYVNCVEGIYFEKNPETRKALRFELTGIVFQQTALIFEDCSFVKIYNCSFNSGLTPLNFYLKKGTNFSLDIGGSSGFRNNSLCIKFLLFNDIENYHRHIEINIADTYFYENRFYNGSKPTDQGAIKLTTDVSEPVSLLHLEVSCYRVTFTGSLGSFLKNNIAKAVTKEMYNHVQLEYNEAVPSYSSGTKPKLLVDSLYSSRAKKIHARFIGVRCIHNNLMRCITIKSNEADVQIQDSQFTGQSTVNASGTCVFLECSGNASLTVYNTTFEKNNAKEGGGLYVNCPRGILRLKLIDVNFTRCFSRRYGCAVMVGRPRQNLSNSVTIPKWLHVSFRNVQFKSNGNNSRGSCISVYILLKSGTVEIDKCTWSDNSTTNGFLFWGATGNTSDVTISNSIFLNNGTKRASGAIIRLEALNSHLGNATILNSSLAGSKHKQNQAMPISPKYHIKLKNVSAVRYENALVVLLTRPAKNAVNVLVDNCKFVNNSKDMYIYLRDPNSVQLIIKNTAFIGSLITGISYAILFVIPPLKNISVSTAIVTLDNNTFHSRPSSCFALFFQGKKNITIRNTTFTDCVCFHRKKWRNLSSKSAGSFYETSTGAISILTSPDKYLQFGCVQLDDNNDTHPLWSYDSHVLFEDTIFSNNLGLLAGGVYISNGNTTFKRCTFENNLATHLAGHVYSAYGTGQVNFKDCSFQNHRQEKRINKTTFDKATFLYSESGGPVYFTNTSMVSTADMYKYNIPVFETSNGGYVRMDENSTIQCSRGYKLKLDNTTHFVYTEKNKSSCRVNVTALRYSCQLCSAGYYSLQKGFSHGLIVNSTLICLTCPFGANCIKRNIAAKPNFWGYRISRDLPELKFSPCPEHYCNSPAPHSKMYNSCHGKRAGFLCGKCSPEYSETLFSTECRKSAECNNYWLWVLTMLSLTTGFVVYLLIKPPILSSLARQIFWFRNREVEQIREDLGQVDGHTDSGYLKITFFFYQAAELLIVGSAESLLNKIAVIQVVVDAFNFEVRSLDKGIGCPFPGLTIVTKELLLSATVLVTMAEAVIFYGVHSAFNVLRQKRKPSLLHYMAVVLEILLLGYERLAETSLKLMHCVSIGTEKRLFFNGEIVCWQWWQYILLAYVVGFVVPFIVVLYCGSSMLYRASISTGEFLGACIFPLPFLTYWFVKKMLNSRDNNPVSAQLVNSQHILEVLHGPFRPPTDSDAGTLYWESVLICRRFVLLACHAFFTNSMFRMICITGACVLMLLHHVLKNPYRDPIANKAETFSLLTLVMMAVINLTKATLVSFGTSTDGPTKPYLETLEWAEFCALAFLPALLSIFLVFAIFSQLVRLLVSLAKKLIRCLRWPRISFRFTRQLDRPLLDISEGD